MLGRNIATLSACFLSGVQLSSHAVASAIAFELPEGISYHDNINAIGNNRSDYASLFIQITKRVQQIEVHIIFIILRFVDHQPEFDEDSL